jgi:hypothetical protein
MKENYLFKRYSVKKIRPDIPSEPVSFLKYNDSLILSDWLPDTGLQKCEPESDSTLECTYLYKKDGISVRIVTRKKIDTSKNRLTEDVFSTFIFK